MFSKLTESAQAASSKTLDAFAQLICALAPEVCSMSFHDFTADTLLLSEDFLLPEDHQLVEECLARDKSGTHSVHYGTREGSRYSVAMPVHDARGEVNGALRLSIDSHVTDARTREPLEERLAPLMVCLAAEFERRRALTLGQAAEAQQLAQIDNALDAERFELYVQPIRSLHESPDSGHYEVLLRLRMADGSLLEPRTFLETAAHRNLMPSIDRWVVRTLLLWLVNNRRLWARAPTVFCINLASQSMTDANFVSFVESCVKKSGLPPQALCFEVTERFASSGNISVSESMRRLEALGCEVALDDFGANAPSYGYLRTIPAHYFKIDGSLVVAAPTDRVARAVISSIVRMASDLGVQTVAESVESDVELQAVRARCRLRARIPGRKAPVARRLLLPRVGRPRRTSAPALPVGIRQLAEHLLQCESPARADHLEVVVVEIDADVRGEPELVAPHDGEIKGRAHGEIRADGRVHGHERAFGRLSEAARARDHPVDDGLAILRFPYLEVGRLARGFDEVAGGVDVKEPRLLAPDLPSEDERTVEVVAVFLQVHGIARMHLAQRIAHDACGVEHIVRPKDLGRCVGVLEILVEQVDDRLGDGQVARRQEHQHALVRALEGRHLAERVDLIDTGVSPGIGQQHQPGIDQQADTVGHAKILHHCCCCCADSATSTFASMRSPVPPWRMPRTGAASR
jgi:EAL domain-containing protein (putative c-di-GMP-specific phosphodiesterase class I)